MRVKIGDVMSEPRTVLGEVPQGSLLGVLLFNLSIDDFEAFSHDVQEYNPTDSFNLTSMAPNPPLPTPVPLEPTTRDYRYLPPWKSHLLQVLKYVDDNIINEKLNFDSVATDQYSFCLKRAIITENLFRLIVHKAESQGMKVNCGKTNCLCIAELKSYIPKAFIVDSRGNRIESGNSMKVLGFHFSSDPDMAAQVEAIKRKFRARLWILRHLRHRGFSQLDLLKVYKAVILPVHDYCSCVFNNSLTLNQASALERLQAQALKSIFGYEHSYRAQLEIINIPSLQERRDKRTKKFARKCLLGDKYKKWFLLNPAARPTRGQTVYQEEFAPTKRLYNSPIYAMRRVLNGRQI